MGILAMPWTRYDLEYLVVGINAGLSSSMNSRRLFHEPYLLSGKGEVLVILRIVKDIVNREFYSPRPLGNKESYLTRLSPPRPSYRHTCKYRTQRQFTI